MEKADSTVIRTLVQIVLNGMSQHEVNWQGIASCFEKCADIARRKAQESGQLDTKFKPMQWEGRTWDLQQINSRT